MNQKYSSIFILLVFLTVCNAVVAQKRFNGEDADKMCKGATFIVVDNRSNIPTYIQLGETTNYPIADFPKLSKTLLKMNLDDDLREYKRSRDYVGFIHHHYRQFYNDIPVEGGEYVAHERAGRIISMDGLFIDSITVSKEMKVMPDTAVKIAVKKCGAKKYKWEDATEEAKFRRSMKDSTATAYPKAELCIASRNLDLKKREWHLCYQVNVSALEPASNDVYFVDVQSAEIIGKKSASPSGKLK